MKGTPKVLAQQREGQEWERAMGASEGWTWLFRDGTSAGRWARYGWASGDEVRD